MDLSAVQADTEFVILRGLAGAEWTSERILGRRRQGIERVCRCARGTPSDWVLGHCRRYVR